MSVPQVRSRVRICLVSFQYSTAYPCAYPCAYPHSHTDPSACVRALRMPSHMMWKALASLVACRSNGLASWSRDRVNLFFTLMASINFTTEDGSSFPLALITFGVCFLMRIFARIPHVYPCMRIPVCNCMRILLVSCKYTLTDQTRRTSIPLAVLEMAARKAPFPPAREARRRPPTRRRATRARTGTGVR